LIFSLRASGEVAADARAPQSPTYGYPARRRSSTHDFVCGATRHGQRGARAPPALSPLLDSGTHMNSRDDYHTLSVVDASAAVCRN